MCARVCLRPCARAFAPFTMPMCTRRARAHVQVWMTELQVAFGRMVAERERLQAELNKGASGFVEREAALKEQLKRAAAAREAERGEAAAEVLAGALAPTLPDSHSARSVCPRWVLCAQAAACRLFAGCVAHTGGGAAGAGRRAPP